MPNPVERSLIAPVQKEEQARTPFMVGREWGIVAQHIRAVAHEGGRVGQIRELNGDKRANDLSKEEAIQLQTGDERIHSPDLHRLDFRIANSPQLSEKALIHRCRQALTSYRIYKIAGL
jgi:hypothetical protein